jgi:hypothetical protein
MNEELSTEIADLFYNDISMKESPLTAAGSRESPSVEKRDMHIILVPY